VHIVRHVLPCLAMFVLAGAQAGTEAQKSGDELKKMPEWPVALRLAPISGFESDDDYLRAVRCKVADLCKEEVAATDPLIEIDHRVAAANLLLGKCLEPACSAKFLGIASPVSANQTRSTFEEVDAVLAHADGLVLQAEAGGDSSPGRLREIARQVATLRTFSDALRVYLLMDAEDDVERRARHAAASLSVLLEDANPEVVAAATLWQARLRSVSAKPARALTLLDPPLARPPSGTLRYSFFARLLSCRLIAGGGGYGSATALMIQMEKLVDEWFVDAGDRADARRTIALVEIQILRDWRSELNSPDHGEERTWCDERIDVLVRQHFATSQTVLRLDTAIPIIKLPAGERTGPQPPQMDDR